MINMYVQGITLDPVTNMPIVVLKGDDSDDVLPIWIGVFEANAIAMQLEGVTRPRPMTHDLINSIINSLGAKVDHIYIHSLEDNTFFAEIVFNKNGETIKIDSRPSDAINVALRSNAPIFVAEEVLEKASLNHMSDKSDEEIQEWLESIKPEDFEG